MRNISDTRWFVNEKHDVAKDGKVGIVTQKYGNGINIAIQNANPTKVTFMYNKKYGYPYKTTIQNSASGWLIFNPDLATSSSNSFQVEFIDAGKWTGEHETNTTTRNIQTSKINRRTIW